MRRDEDRYTPEEVQEILRIALQQRKDTFSVQEIESIGREVGIEPEAVHAAIEHYRRLREAEQRAQEQERIAQEHDRIFWQHAGNQLLFAAMFLAIFLAAAVCVMGSFFSQSERMMERPMPRTARPEPIIVPLPQHGQEEMNRLQKEALRRQFENTKPGQ